VYVGIVLLLFNFSATYIETWGAKIAFSLVWAAKHAIVEGIAFLLMQKGLGI
jgi:NADH:ubiquinone oxidoreductase subunit 6 (subunit J)